MRSQSKGIGSADNSASIRGNIHTIPALLHCASHRRDNVPVQRRRAAHVPWHFIHHRPLQPVLGDWHKHGVRVIFRAIDFVNVCAGAEKP